MAPSVSPAAKGLRPAFSIVENNGYLVTKDGLLEIVWQDVSVEEANNLYNV